MSTQVTLTLPDGILASAEILAQRSGRSVADVLSETLELSLRPLDDPAIRQPMESLSDEELLAATASRLPEAHDQRLSELLNRQQAATLTPAEQTELTALMLTYQVGLLRKAQALDEAVRRGLREPIDS